MSFPFRRRLTGALSFLKRDHDYWHPWLPPILDSSANGRSRYYLDFSCKADHPGPISDCGIPFTVYGAEIGRQHYAIDICQYALGHHERWLVTSESRHRLVFLRQADWLCETLRVRKDLPGAPGFWMAEFAWGEMPAPWPSAMAQGQGISVLTRAHALTDNPKYLDCARCACEGLRVPVVKGGVTNYDGDLPYFEEAPLRRPSRILNGFIFALWGVHDLVNVTEDKHTAGLFDAAVVNLLHLLPQYDIGFWTRYDLESTWIPHTSSTFYQELHANQLLVLHHLTGQAIFLEYARRWQKQLERMPNRLLALSLKLLNQLARSSHT